MKINPIQFNLIQSKPQNRVSCPLCMNNSLDRDVFTFTGNTSVKDDIDKIGELVPKHTGFVYKKIKDEEGNVVDKVPVEVSIVKHTPDTFQFKQNDEVLGKVILKYIPAEKCKDNSSDDLYKNYKDEDVVGDRIEVGYLYNYEKENYGGIGHLADLVAVASCKELGINTV